MSNKGLYEPESLRLHRRTQLDLAALLESLIISKSSLVQDTEGANRCIAEHRRQAAKSEEILRLRAATFSEVLVLEPHTYQAQTRYPGLPEVAK